MRYFIDCNMYTVLLSHQLKHVEASKLSSILKLVLLINKIYEPL